MADVKFEFVNRVKDIESGLKLPKRATKNSAGYDFYTIDEVTIPKSINNGLWLQGKPTLVKTGVKASFPDDLVLMLYNRSSNPGKRGLILANGVGVIDADYYENENNDGEIMFAFYNYTDEDVVVKKGEAIGQGVFQLFFLTEDDQTTGERKGGYGSTGE